MTSIQHFFRILILLALIPAGAGFAQTSKPELLLYCGITMVRPMTEISRLFEQRENVKISIAQGGSEDLYRSAQKTGTGDLYLPGESSYYYDHLKEGLFVSYNVVGNNRLALMTRKGNPKHIKADIRELLRRDIVVALGNAESGSVGKESKRALDTASLYPKVVRNAAFLSPDSRSLALALKRDEADVTLNWRAVGYFPDNIATLEVIDLDPALATPQPLMLILLKSSRHPEIAKRFMAFSAGPEGQAIFRKHGFLDEKR